MTQKIFVIEIDAGDDRNHRMQNIRGVQPPAKSNLEHAEIEPPICEVFEGHRSYTFEISRVGAQLSARKQFLNHRLYARQPGGQIGIADLFSIHANPLVDSLQVW